jgi:hypothetical protein
MSILIKSEEGYYEIPADVLEKCKISKEQFEEGREKMSADVEGQSSHEVYIGNVCCMDKRSLWASCLKK